MGPFGSNQSRHVDNFGAKKHNFDEHVAKKLSFGRLVDKKKRHGHRFMDAAIYI